MQALTRTKLRFTLLGTVIGGVLVGIVFGLYVVATKHHYRELDTFFRGEVAGQKVEGISYTEYHGIGFMEGNQWKVLLHKSNGGLVTLYNGKSTFQESVPHQPRIKIKERTVEIHDGETQLVIAVDSLRTDK